MFCDDVFYCISETGERREIKLYNIGVDDLVRLERKTGAVPKYMIFSIVPVYVKK